MSGHAGIKARLAVAALLLALFLGSFMPKAPPPQAQSQAAATISDITLYQHISSRIGHGQGYYAAAAQEQRRHGFPLRPFVTMRLPTMAWLNAAVDPRVALCLLLALTAILWLALPGLALWERVAVGLLVLAGSWQAFAAYSSWVHEYWAGLLLALSAAIYPRSAWLAIVAALAAVLIRELALPFLLLGAVFALSGRRWREAVGWGAAITVFAIALAAHAHEVTLVLLPGDRVSEGWLGLPGYATAIDRIAHQSPLGVLPPPVADTIAALAPVGWLGLRNRTGLFMCLYLIGMVAFLAIFPRDNNLFWGLIIAPAWLAGLAFLPRLAGWLARGGPLVEPVGARS
ncbi:MAG: hypothetical protein P0Y56_12675 [Candidatus Andeanibacterium colombiense]|uniref:Uncharacterized protein n=1 Tax=Candidatus Andeanibacterium colombiense TaxID=3121345 RepID=A0AAJ5X4H3_9SPHN|nr:MAG: hypothetical protein P0Y56_12675 [Sphingomonadaceae bacterium]